MRVSSMGMNPPAQRRRAGVCKMSAQPSPLAGGSLFFFLSPPVLWPGLDGRRGGFFLGADTSSRKLLCDKMVIGDDTSLGDSGRVADRFLPCPHVMMLRLERGRILTDPGKKRHLLLCLRTNLPDASQEY